MNCSFKKKKKIFLWSVLFDGRSASIIVITEKNTDTQSLWCSLSSTVKNISYLSTSPMSQLSNSRAPLLSVMPNTTRKISW